MSIMGVYSKGDDTNSAELLYIGMSPLIHSRKENPGIVSRSRGEFFGVSDDGTILMAEDCIDELKGSCAISQIREDREKKPYFFERIGRLGSPLVVAFEGCLTNIEELEDGIKRGVFSRHRKGGYAITREDSAYRESVILGNLISQAGVRDMQEAIKNLSHIRGSFNLIMMTREYFIAIRDQEATRPFSAGMLKGNRLFDKEDEKDLLAGRDFVFSPDTSAFDMIGALYSEELEPGTALIYGPDGVEKVRVFPEARRNHCIRELEFYSNNGSRAFGKNVTEFRKELGEILAHRNGKNDYDFVLANSGPYSEGFSRALGIERVDALEKNYSIGKRNLDREMSEGERLFHLKRKYRALSEYVKGSRIALVEDSVKDGVRLKAKVDALRRAGAREVDVYVASPPIERPCKYGRFGSDFIEPDALKDYTGADRVLFQTVEDIRDTLSNPEDFCMHCKMRE